jgi:large subunit ribosomal protein L23
MSKAPKAAVSAAKPAHYDLIKKPVITEKATLASENNAVVFQVAMDASKPEIKEAVEAIFGVKVKAVNTTITKGKAKKFRGRAGERSDKKKAYVTLEAGNTIDVSTGL